MNLIPAYHASKEDLASFLEKNPHIQKETFLNSGYAVEINGEIEGCFNLNQMESGVYWLKQLYITKAEAAKLPVLIESILALAKNQQAKVIHVHSHQPMVDILLEALQFHLQKEMLFKDKYPVNNGNWWSYSVS